MAAHPSSTWLVVDQAKVQLALQRLLRARVHQHFVGYLCLLYTARSSGRRTRLHPNFKAFFDRFLRVDGARKPYLQPFTDSNRGTRWSPFFNENVAGSYAPSSLRGQVAPLLRLATIAGVRSAATYSLRPDHADRALHDLLLGNRLPAASLSIFLYRDFGFAHGSATAADVLGTFRDEFGLRATVPSEGEDFALLFDDDSPEFSESNFFVPATPGP